MRKAVLCLLVIVLVCVAVTPSLAQPATEKEQAKLKVHIHYRRDGKPTPQPGTCDPTADDTVGHYGLTGWLHAGTVVYHVNYGSIPATVSNAQAAIAASFQVWESETRGQVDFVEGAATRIKVAKNDGVHVVAWGSVSSRNAIAVTYTWYIPSTGEVVDQDVLMNANLPWSYASVGNPDKVCGGLTSYDVRNILTHEVGHWVGLDDLYGSVDQDLTMYGYGDKGELKKDTLSNGDKLGMTAMY